MKLKALLGDYANTRALKSGQVRSEHVQFDFTDKKTVNKVFKPLDDAEIEKMMKAVADFQIPGAHRLETP